MGKKHTRVRMVTLSCYLGILSAGLIALSACGDDNSHTPATETVVTRTVVPPTPKPTPQPLTPTPASATDLPGPLAISPVATEVNVLVVPAEAQVLLDLTWDDLATQPGVDAADIRLLSLEAFTWRDDSWGCTSRYAEGHTAGTYTHGYRILYSEGSRVYAYHTDKRSTFFICKDRAWMALEGKPLPTDPIAQSVVELAARDAARRLAVTETQLELVSLLAVNWSDSSLGCPKPGGEYEDQETLGYRIVFRLDDAAIIYHTSLRHLVHCAPEEEILPGILRRAMPTPTPLPNED